MMISITEPTPSGTRDGRNPGPDDLKRARRLGADIVGVRGSACEGGREGTVSAARVRALRAALALSAGVSPVLDHP